MNTKDVMRVGLLLALMNGCATTSSRGSETGKGEEKSMGTKTIFRSKDGTAIGCSKSGSGPPLVLVHGTAADHARWAPVLPALEERFTVYACDRRGRGLSSDATEYALDREFEDVAAIVEGIGGSVDLIGHSYGGLCSLEAARIASNLHKLVLYEPPIPIGSEIYPAEVLGRLQTLLDAGDREGVVTTFMREVPRVPPDQLEKLRAAPAWKNRIAAAHTIVRELRAHEDYRFDPENFRAVQVPTLLLLGGDSPPFFRTGIERAQSALPNVRLVVMPGQQHAAMDTGPKLFLDAVLSFLSE